MPIIRNPFIINGYISPAYFCDRKAESEILIRQMTNGNNIALISTRRMGKTGLIRHCFQSKEIQKIYYTFFVDIYATKSLREFVFALSKEIIESLKSSGKKAIQTFWESMKSLQASLTFDFNGNPSFNLGLGDIQSPDATLDEIFHYLEQANKPCIVAIDEFQQIMEYPEKGVEGLLRSYIQFTPNVHFIFSGSKKHLMESIFFSIKRPFYQSTQKLFLAPIPYTPYREFAKKLFDERKKTLQENIFHEIYQSVKGHTWYMQYLLNRLYSLPQQTPTIELLHTLIQEIIQEEEYTYQTYFQFLTSNQIQLLKAIAKEEIVNEINSATFIKKYDLKGASSINVALKSLINKEFVLKEQQGYIVYDRFLAIWLKGLV